MLSVCKKFNFSASHRLYRSDWDKTQNSEVFGKCSNYHGHNYTLEVHVSGEIDPDTGMIIDASKLGKIVEEVIISEVDHKVLNEDVTWLNGSLPSTEVLVEAFWSRLEKPISQAAKKGQLEMLHLQETEKIHARKTRN